MFAVGYHSCDLVKLSPCYDLFNNTSVLAPKLLYVRYNDKAKAIYQNMFDIKL